MARLPGQGQFGPRDALDPFDHADGDVLVLQHRALLDVQLDERVWDTPGNRRGAAIADAVEFVTDAQRRHGRSISSASSNGMAPT